MGKTSGDGKRGDGKRGVVRRGEEVVGCSCAWSSKVLICRRFSIILTHKITTLFICVVLPILKYPTMQLVGRATEISQKLHTEYTRESSDPSLTKTIMQFGPADWHRLCLRVNNAIDKSFGVRETREAEVV